MYVLAILSAPMLYGVLCVPLTSAFLARFPAHLNALGGTHNPKLVLCVEVMQLLTLFLCGAAVQWIAGRSKVAHRILVTATLTMLSIGVAAQYQYWSAMPAWHHYIFFLLIVAAMPTGALWVRRARPPKRLSN